MISSSSASASVLTPILSAIPDASLVVYQGAGHSPNWEQPERVAGDIDAFLRTTVEARTT